MLHPIARLKGVILRLTCPLFFRRIGRGVYFDGSLRLPTPFRNISIGSNTRVGDRVYFNTSRKSKILIGDNCSINSGCHIVALESVTIGDNVAIAEYVSIRDQEHLFTPSNGVAGTGYRIEAVSIGSNVWICRGAYIGPGTVIGCGSIVAANSVVRGVFPMNALIAGAPATVRKLLT